MALGCGSKLGNEYREFMIKCGFKDCQSTPCVFWHEDKGITTRGIAIQKSEVSIDNWCEHGNTEMINVVNSDISSYNDDNIRNTESGLDNWKEFHPASTKSELFKNNIIWNNDPQKSCKTRIIPINLL